MNSIDLVVKGGKWVEFQDGTIITYQPHQDKVLNSLWGTLVHLICGKCEFEDKKNGITGWYEIGFDKKKPMDYFSGEISKDGKVVSKMHGNQMGYIDFDGIRYWDVRDQVNYRVQGVDLEKEAVGSDCRNRMDSQQHKAGNMVEAQQSKTNIENLQRNDRKLREASDKRRSEGGKKIDYSSYKMHPLCGVV